MSKRAVAIVAVLVLILVLFAVLDGDRLHDALIRMHGGSPHH